MRKTSESFKFVSLVADFSILVEMSDCVSKSVAQRLQDDGQDKIRDRAIQGKLKKERECEEFP